MRVISGDCNIIRYARLHKAADKSRTRMMKKYGKAGSVNHSVLASLAFIHLENTLSAVDLEKYENDIQKALGIV